MRSRGATPKLQFEPRHRDEDERHHQHDERRCYHLMSSFVRAAGRAAKFAANRSFARFQSSWIAATCVSLSPPFTEATAARIRASDGEIAESVKPPSVVENGCEGAG